jgi:hypothetical protein
MEYIIGNKQNGAFNTLFFVFLHIFCAGNLTVSSGLSLTEQAHRHKNEIAIPG